MRRAVLVALLLLDPAAVSAAGGQCTIAYAMGNAVDDGRPILWRNYDWQDSPHATQVVTHQTNAYLEEWGPHAWIGTSQESWYVFGGINEQGVGCFNTLIEDFSEEGGYDYGNYRIQAWILGNATSVDEVRTAVDEQVRFWNGEPGGVDHDWSYPSAGGGYYPAMTLVVVDAHGEASLFEIAKTFWHEYDPQNPARLEQFAVQVGVRANQPHRRDDHRDNDGTDWLTTGGRRYAEALQNLRDVATNGDGVTLRELMEIVSRHGEPGFEAHAFGPLPLDEEGEYQNSNWKNQDGSILWGAAPGEDPRAATFFLAPGPPDYGCYVPMWAAAWDSVSPRLGDLGPGGIVHHVWAIFAARVDTGYDDYVHGLLAEMEDNHRRAAGLARALWAEHGFDAAVADAITDEAAENLFVAVQAMSAAPAYELPVPPSVTDIAVAWSDTVGTFSAQASDDGTIVAWEWDFGDGSTSSEAVPLHDYGTDGEFLVRVRVTDDGGLRNTRWAIVEVGGGVDRGSTSAGSTDGGGSEDTTGDGRAEATTSSSSGEGDEGGTGADAEASGVGHGDADGNHAAAGCGCTTSSVAGPWLMVPLTAACRRRRRLKS